MLELMVNHWMLMMLMLEVLMLMLMLILKVDVMMMMTEQVHLDRPITSILKSFCEWIKFNFQFSNL